MSSRFRKRPSHRALSADSRPHGSPLVYWLLKIEVCNPLVSIPLLYWHRTLDAFFQYTDTGGFDRERSWRPGGFFVPGAGIAIVKLCIVLERWL
jgi:hypothetical protein